MIDYKEMLNHQQKGIALLDSLQEDEKDILKHYCSLLCEGLIEVAAKQKRPIDEVVVNGIKTGIALGLGLKVEKGEVLNR